MSDVTIRVHGPGAERLAEELALAFEDAFGQMPEKHLVQPQSDTQHKGWIEAGQAVLLVLNVVIAADKLVDIAQRRRVREKLEGIFARLKKHQAEQPTTAAVIEVDGVATDEADQLIAQIRRFGAHR